MNLRNLMMFRTSGVWLWKMVTFTINWAIALKQENTSTKPLPFNKKRETEKDRKERELELLAVAKKTLDASSLERVCHTAAVYDGVAKARKAKDSPVGEELSGGSPPWTDESKQLAVSRSSRPKPRSLFAKRKPPSGFLEMVDRKVRRAARNGPRSFTVVEFGDYLLRDDDDGDSLPGRADGSYPGKETESEKGEREALEKELKELAGEEDSGWKAKC